MRENVLKKSKLIFLIVNFSIVIRLVLALDSINYLRSSLDWYVSNNYLNITCASQVEGLVNIIVKLVSIYAEDLCLGFNLPKETLIAPIYTGYEKYYSVDKTDGEHYYLPKPKF